MRILIVESNHRSDIDYFLEKREYLSEEVYDIISGKKKNLNNLDTNFGYESDNSIVFCNVIEDGDLLNATIKILTETRNYDYKCLIYMGQNNTVEYKNIYKNKLIKG